MGEDEELEKIKQKKKEQLIKKMSASERNKSQPAKNPVDVTDATFNQVIQNPLVVVDCWAAWCGPCRMVSPIIEELARDYAGRIVFGKLNVDENREVPTRYQIMSIPTLLVFKNGKLVERIVGAMPRPALEPKITRHL